MFKRYLASISLGTLVLVLLFGLFVTFINIEHARADEGDGTAATYGISLVDGAPSAKPEDIQSAEWIHAGLLKITFANGLIANFTAVNDADNDTAPLMDQRLLSADGEGHVTYASSSIGCPAIIDFDKSEDRDDRDFVLSALDNGVLELQFRRDSLGSCVDAGSFNVSPGNPQLSMAYFAWTDENTIATVDGESPGEFKRASEAGSNFFIRTADEGASTCRDKLLVDPATNAVIWWELRDDNRANFGGTPDPIANADSGCEYRTNTEHPEEAGTFDVGFPPNNVWMSLAGTPTSPVPVGSLTGADTTPTCESEGGVFSFILCPALEYANDAIGWLDDRIVSALNVSSDYYTNTDVKDAWGNIRNVAYFLLVPILLFMVIGTALQFSFLDAYTVKRAMPRLFVAVIFIAVSYDVTRIMIEVTNGVGRGVGGLIASPFGGYDALTLPNIFSAPQGAGNLVWGGVLAAVGIASLFVVSIGILFSYLFVAVLALLIIFILLSVRELLIVFLLIMSPLAILSWIFPSNDKLWKLWWSSFTKLLYLFPIIMALLTSGRAFAYIIKTTPTDENAVVLTIVKLTAFIGPYFFIPKAFQMAGGAFATLAGMANDRGKGLFDRQRKYRGESRKNRLARISSNRPRSKNTITRGMYAAGSAMLSQVDAVKKDGVRRGLLSGAAGDSRRAAEKRQRDEERQHAEKDPTLQQNIGNDQFGEVILQLIDNPGVSDESLMKYLQAHNYSETGAIELISSARSLHSDYGHALAGTALMGKVGSNTSYPGGEDQLLDDIIRAGHGSEADMMALLGQARATAANKGLFHLSGGSYGEDSAMLQALLRVKKNGGAPLAEDIEYTDEITGERGVLQTAGLDESAVRELINNRKEEKARASMQSWDFSRIHATSARKLAGSLHQEVQRMSTDASSETDPGLRAQKMRALGQKIAQVRSIQTSISQSSSQEVKEIFADALDNADGSQPALNVGGDSYSSLSELVSIPTQIHGDMEDFVRTNGETLGPRDAQTVNDLRSLSGGYRSTTQSPYDGMSEAQRRAMMDQQNGPNG